MGNICRSPLAEGIAKAYIDTKGLDIRIDSAGTGSWHIGEPPCAHSIKVAKQHGIDISTLRGRQVNKADFDRFDKIVALDDKNIADLKAMGCSNLYKLGDFGNAGRDVPDPFFFDGFSGFDKVFSMIHTSVHALMDEYTKKR